MLRAVRRQKNINKAKAAIRDRAVNCSLFLLFCVESAVGFICRP